MGVKIITYHWTVIPIRRNLQYTGARRRHVRRLQARGQLEGPAGRKDPAASLPTITGNGSPLSSGGRYRWPSSTTCGWPAIPTTRPAFRSAIRAPTTGTLPRYSKRSSATKPSSTARTTASSYVWERPAEGLKNPRTEILPIVQYLGDRGKIYQIHMRNIRGGLHDFAEVYPDEGDMDFLQIMRILRDTQFAGSICPDHMPRHPDDPGGLQAFAFGYGYIKALIQAVNSEV